MEKCERKKEQIYWIQKQFIGRFQQFTRRLKFIRSDVDLIETEGKAQRFSFRTVCKRCFRKKT